MVGVLPERLKPIERHHHSVRTRCRDSRIESAEELEDRRESPPEVLGQAILVISGPGRKMYQYLRPKPEGAIVPMRSMPQGGRDRTPHDTGTSMESQQATGNIPQASGRLPIISRTDIDQGVLAFPGGPSRAAASARSRRAASSQGMVPSQRSVWSNQARAGSSFSSRWYVIARKK